MRDRPILLLALAQTLIWACLYYSFPGLLLHWEQDLGWSRADLTAAITLAVLMSAMVSPWCGRLIDAGKGPIMMTASAIAGGLLLITLSLVDALWQFYLLWGLIGICMGGGLYEPCFAMITRTRGVEAKRAIIFVTLVAGFASAISFPLANMLASNGGWRLAVTVFGLISIVGVSPLIWLGSREMEASGQHKVDHSSHSLDFQHQFLSDRVFWFLALGFACGALLHGVTIHHLLPILDERGVNHEVAVMAISLIGPMQVTGRLVIMAFEKRISNHSIASSCFLFMALSIVILSAAANSPAALIAFVVLFGGSYGMVSIIRPVIARDILGEHQFGSKSGVLALIYLLGSASAPFLASLIWSIGGYDLVLNCIIFLSGLGLMLYLMAARRARIRTEIS